MKTTFQNNLPHLASPPLLVTYIVIFLHNFSPTMRKRYFSSGWKNREYLNVTSFVCSFSDQTTCCWFSAVSLRPVSELVMKFFFLFLLYSADSCHLFAQLLYSLLKNQSASYFKLNWWMIFDICLVNRMCRAFH